MRRPQPVKAGERARVPDTSANIGTYSKERASESHHRRLPSGRTTCRQVAVARIDRSSEDVVDIISHHQGSGMLVLMKGTAPALIKQVTSVLSVVAGF